ncbi:MAG: DNA primase, partial [Candidatus Omnitrophota bacterium]
DIYKINEWALQFFHDRLLTSRDATAKAARDYLKNRGVDLETVKEFRLGYAPDGWEELIGVLKNKGVSLEVMHQAGLVIARDKGGYYDRFRGRIIFPIFDINSRPVAFGARALSETEGAKYINSPETPVYTKGRHLFGLNLTKTSIGEKDAIVIVEGYMDMIMPFTHGVSNIAASLGTALTVEQIRLIRRYSTNVIMLFDTDPAGQSAIIRSLDMLIDEGMNVKVVRLEEAQDPDSFIRCYGIERFHERIAQALSLFDYKFQWLATQHGISTVEGKSQICQQMLATIGHYKDEVIKYELSRQLAKALNLPETVIFKQAGQLQQPKGQVREEAVGPVVSRSYKTPAVETLLLALFLKDPLWVKQAITLIGPSDFSEGLMREIIEVLWQISQEHQEWSVNDILVRIKDETAHNLLTKLMNQENVQAGQAQQVFSDCVGRIQKERLKKQKQELMNQIKEAEARGEASTIQELRAKFQDLIKM